MLNLKEFIRFLENHIIIISVLGIIFIIAFYLTNGFHMFTPEQMRSFIVLA